MDTANVSGRQSADETAAYAIRYTPVDIFFFITTGNQADNIPNTNDLKKKKKKDNWNAKSTAWTKYIYAFLKIYKK